METMKIRICCLILASLSLAAPVEINSSLPISSVSSDRISVVGQSIEDAGCTNASKSWWWWWRNEETCRKSICDSATDTHTHTPFQSEWLRASLVCRVRPRLVSYGSVRGIFWFNGPISMLASRCRCSRIAAVIYTLRTTIDLYALYLFHSSSLHVLHRPPSTSNGCDNVYI